MRIDKLILKGILILIIHSKHSTKIPLSPMLSSIIALSKS
ncbi:Hypothetical protein LOCK900_0091 [Lacticaseibacillus rhamnosus LOCK900]|nr:Hypothetical protein LOCK900_0091 [Lacticaseibacillus rhamnosus LOCK900]EHJ33471.1 hypothetical protein HMPREF0541_00988 [Lacticaseibacillus rhamnosus ATCC 21052]